MLRRNSRIGWAFTTWICCFAISAGVSFAEVPKTVRVVLSGADAQSASVAYEVNGQLIKLLPASDGSRYVSTSDTKLSLHVEHPGLGASVTTVVLPEVATVSVQVDLGTKTSAHVIESGKSAFRPVPAADSPKMSTIAGSNPVTIEQGASPILNISDYFSQLQTNKAAGQAESGQSNPTAGPRGGGMGGSDGCTMAEAISGAGTYNFDSSAATTDGNPHAACLSFSEDQIEGDIWYCWTSDCDGTVRVETCGLTTVDTRIAVYSSCNVCPPDRKSVV